MRCRRLRLRRVWRTSRLLQALAQHEPATCHLVSELGTYGVRPWVCRAWAVWDGPELAGALVVTRDTFDEWVASVFVGREEVAGALARRLDRSPAHGLRGPTRHVGPVRLASRRAVDGAEVPWVVMEPPVSVLGEPDERTRLAGPADLDALVDLYERYELFHHATRWQVRWSVRSTLRRCPVIVADAAGGGLAGAAVVSARTARYAVLDSLTVRPAYRRSGLAWAICARAQALANAYGVGGVLAVAPTNPMTPPTSASDDSWSSVWLVRARRFPGQGRLRALYARVGVRASAS